MVVESFVGVAEVSLVAVSSLAAAYVVVVESTKFVGAESLVVVVWVLVSAIDTLMVLLGIRLDYHHPEALS